MNLEVPDWWSFVLLALASYRLWRLVGVDSITEPFRDWVTRVDEYHSGRPQNYREKLDELITCPWCLGFWVSIGWWLFWVVWHQGAVWVAVPFAIGAVVGYLGKAD
ncbi:MAG TPA: DUF1360 domain-containing protein [Candidatus Eisenbacteria bacterium]|nr:DUF1360 domain-containing protein [Candidatus Eisenbacteria bacterium]